MHEVLLNRLGGLSLPRKSVLRLTDRPDMNSDVYRGRKTATRQQLQRLKYCCMGRKIASHPSILFFVIRLMGTISGKQLYIFLSIIFCNFT